MKGMLKILCLEDRKSDFMLLRQHVMRVFPGVVFTHATNKAEFLAMVNRGGFDVVIADYNLPDYNGLSALLYVREHYPFLPFIFVTGMLVEDEEEAITILRSASAYVLKDHLAMLPDQLRMVMETAKRTNDERKAQEQRRRIRNLQLQKAVGLLQSAEDFAEKEEILRLIEESIRIPGKEDA